MNNSYDPSAERYDSTPAATPGPSSSARSRHKRLFRWGTGITLAGFLAGGGIAWAATSGSPAAGASANTQAAVLNSAFSTAASTSSAVPARRVKWALGRLRRVGGVDGEVTFHDKGGYRTLAFERGTIESVSGSDVVVKAPDGTTWTWLIVSNTVVRKGGSKIATSTLSVGESVFAGGPVINGGKDARLIVIRTPKAAGSGSTSTPSSSSTPSSTGSDSAKTSVS
ncbi:MAG: hypothetical protein M3Z75_15165 [Actinomycetota bacterium]|nr:hypothetical protein [Actinomycetota bacterium]